MQWVHCICDYHLLYPFLINCTKTIVRGPFVLFGNIHSLSPILPHLHPTSAPCWYISKTISVCHYLSLPQCLLWRLTVSEQSNSRSIIIDLVTILTLSVTSCCTKLTESTQDQSCFNQQKGLFWGRQPQPSDWGSRSGHQLAKKTDLGSKTIAEADLPLLPEPNHPDIRNKVSVTHHDMSLICSIMKFSWW